MTEPENPYLPPSAPENGPRESTVYRTLHGVALLALGCRALSVSAKAVRGLSSNDHATSSEAFIGLFAVAFCFLLLGLLWKWPLKVGLYVGIFLLLAFGAQIYMWQAWLAYPGTQFTGTEPMLTTLIGGVCCVLLRFFHPKER